MGECRNSLWPCAMTGAVTCFAGIRGIGTIIHGPSGCYFFPSTVLHRELHCTFLIEEDLIFGAEERLTALGKELMGRYRLLAVVNTCTPSITGEELPCSLPHGTLRVDSPGFAGNFEEGYQAACNALPVRTDPGLPGVNLDGLQLLDPFCQGNAAEAERILRGAGIGIAARFCDGTLDELEAASTWSVGTNPDYRSGHGKAAGTFLGPAETSRTLGLLASELDGVDTDPFERERVGIEEAIGAACDKFLTRHDPPVTAIFSGFSYADFAARMLREHLDASVTVLGCRSRAGHSVFRTSDATSLSSVEGLIRGDPPDLILGSSFERMVCPSAAFVPFTYPLRGMVRLRARPLVGTQGLAGLVEDVLNACMDRHATGNR